MLLKQFDERCTDKLLSQAELPGLPFEVIAKSLAPGQSAMHNPGRDGDVVIATSGGLTLHVEQLGQTVESTPGTAVAVLGCSSYTMQADGHDGASVLFLAWCPTAEDEPSVVVHRMDDSELAWAYEMYIGALFDGAELGDPGFGAVFGRIPTGTVSKRHRHQDSELFIGLRGTAEVQVGDQSQMLGPGDVVHLPPFTPHALVNFGDEPFDLISVGWDDDNAADRGLMEWGPLAHLPSQAVLVCPPITPNGGLHLGHLAGPYLRADMLGRMLRTVGLPATFVTGTDDHQSHVATSARRDGTSPHAVARRFRGEILATLESADIEVGVFYDPVADEYIETFRRAWRTLNASGRLMRRTVFSPFCAQCGSSLHQDHAKGRCPTCQAPTAGEICEACGHPNEARELLDLVCAACGGSAELRERPATLLDVEALAPAITAYLADVRGGGQLRLLASALIGKGLPPYEATRPSAWGVAVADGEVLDPWVELAIAHLHVTRAAGGDAPGARRTTVLGFDNSFYYAIVLPAVAIALDETDALPDSFVSNRFLHLEGAKFSTSRRHVIWASELLDRRPSDDVRLALLSRSPDDTVEDITADEALGLGAGDVDGVLRAWLAGFDTLALEDGIPQTGAWTEAHLAMHAAIRRVTDECDHHLDPETFSPRQYVRAVARFLEIASEFRARESALRRLPHLSEEARTSVALEFLTAKLMAVLLWPVVPGLGQRLWSALGYDGEPRRDGNWGFVPTRAAPSLGTAADR